METTNLLPLIDDLEGNIDELEKALGPLLTTNLTDITSKLPLLDRAKLQVLVTYGIESILFSYLNLNDVNARNHPVFQELNRVKQYFAKIKEAEEGEPEKQPNLRLDKGAAGRFITNALAGNDEYDRKRAEQQGEKPTNTHTRFEDTSEQVGTAQRFKHMSKKRKVEEDVDSSQPESTSSGDLSPVDKGKASAEVDKSPNYEGNKKKKKKNKGLLGSVEDTNPDLVIPPAQTVQEQKPTSEYKGGGGEKKSKHHKSHNAPKSGSEAFQKLLNKPPKGHKRQQEPFEYG